MNVDDPGAAGSAGGPGAQGAAGIAGGPGEFVQQAAEVPEEYNFVDLPTLQEAYKNTDIGWSMSN